MKPSTIKILVVTVLVLCGSVVRAQQSVDETKLAQMRVTVQRLEGLVGDQNIPTENRDQMNELLFEKRGELHALLRQKRDALRSSLRAGMSAEESNSISNTIQQLTQEMQQLYGARPTASTSDQPARPQSSGAGTDSTVPANGSADGAATETTTATGSTPVRSAPATTAPGSAATLTPAAATVVPQDPACADSPAGQVSPDVEYQRQIRAVACRMHEARTGAGNAGDALLNFRQYNFVMALAIARAKLPKAAIPELTAQAENASHAKNLTANQSSSSSTSLVAKAGVPAILGFATENGALTKTTDGTAITFTGNPVGLVEALAKKGFIDGFQTQDGSTKFLRKLSFGFSFDTSRGSQAGTFTGSKQQLSGYSLKYNIVDQRDPREKKYTDRWLEITKKQASNLALSLNKFVEGLATPPGLPQFDAWLKTANEALTGKTAVLDIENALVPELDKLGKVELPSDQKAIIVQVGTDFEAFLKERNDILDEISNGWIATLDYNNSRPVGTPSLSNFRFLAEKGAYKGSIDLTANASLTFYNSRPTGPKPRTLRDFKFAGQVDIPIGDVTKTGKFLFSFAGRYERLLADEPIAGTTVVIRKGDIAVGQLKFTIPIRGTAIKIPISMTFANRTELNKEKEVRGNFGITFDLDSIFAKFNPFTQKQ